MLVRAEIVMADYTYTQYVETTLIYDECKKNAKAAARAYLEREFINDAFHRLKETGSIIPRPRQNRRAKCNVRVTLEEVLVFTLLNSQLSTAEINETCGLYASACLTFIARNLAFDTGASIGGG